MNKNLEHCSLSKVKQFVSGLILGENRKLSEKHIGKMSEKVKKGQKVVEKIWINLGFINFRMDDCVSKSDMARKIRRTGSKEFHYTQKWIGKEKFVKSFGIMRDQKRRMRNYGEPSGNICSDLLIEPQVTSLGHDLKWPHDEHTHSADCTWTYHDQNWTKNAQTVHHGPSPTGQQQILLPPKTYLYCTWTSTASYNRGSILPRYTSPLWTIWTQFSDEKVTHLPLPPTQKCSNNLSNNPSLIDRPYQTGLPYES